LYITSLSLCELAARNSVDATGAAKSIRRPSLQLKDWRAGSWLTRMRRVRGFVRATVTLGNCLSDVGQIAEGAFDQRPAAFPLGPDRGVEGGEKTEVDVHRLEGSGIGAADMLDE